MFWKKEKQGDKKPYDYYALVGIEQGVFWCNLHYSENEEDPIFLTICKDLIITLLSDNLTTVYFEILKNQEEVSIINHLEEKCFSNDSYKWKDDCIVVKTNALDYALIEKYLSGAISRYEHYRSPRRISIYGYQNEKILEESLIELDVKNKKGLYDFFILYDEPPQSLEIEIKEGLMNSNELHRLIKNVCTKYGKKVNILLDK